VNRLRTIALALARSFALVLSAAGLSACAIFSSDPSGPAQVDDLVSRVERVYVASEVAKERVESAIEKLQAITAPGFQGQAVPAYERLMTAIELAETHAAELGDSVAYMKEGGAPIFEQWTTDLEAFTNPAMRRRSLTRLVATRERYDAISTAADPALSAYNSLVKSLRDHALFLRHDLNAASLAAINEDLQTLNKQAADVDQRFDACLQAARTYMESTSLPATSAPAAVQPAAEAKANVEPKKRPEETSKPIPPAPEETIQIEEPPVRRDR